MMYLENRIPVFDAYKLPARTPLLERNKSLPEKSNDWGDCRSAYTYVLLKKGVGDKPLKGLFNAITANFNKEDKNGQAYFGRQPSRKS